jgi:transitional endoplasmic reticulum ATPase
LVREAAMLAIEETIVDGSAAASDDIAVSVDHFERALAETTPSVAAREEARPPRE